MKARILCFLVLLVASHTYSQSVDSVIVFDFKKRCDPFFSSKKVDATFCHFYISEKADTVYFSNLECMASRQTTTPTTFRYYLQNGLADGSVRVFFDFQSYSSVLDGEFVKGSLIEGTVKEYYKSGNLKLTGQFLEGQRYGIWTWYYENGQMQRLITYEMGEPVNEQVFRNIESHANDKFGDSLLFSYYSGCDCSKTIRSERLRGGCESWQKMEYLRKKRSYKMKDVLFRESFRTWESGFNSNLVKDSIRKPRMLQNRKIPTEKLETFLREITSIYSDTVFSYQLSEVPEKIRKKDDWSEENKDSLQIDSSVRSSLNSVVVSSVITHFTISFQLGGKKYELYKNASNLYWRIYSPGNKEKGKSFIYFAFDAFLYGELSKKFAGRRTLNQ